MRRFFVIISLFFSLLFFVSCGIDDIEVSYDGSTGGGNSGNSGNGGNGENGGNGGNGENGGNGGNGENGDSDSTGTDAVSDTDEIGEETISIQCTPGETQECYEGPSGTSGVGICKSGIKTCVEDGTDWSECRDQKLPESEICSDGIDQDCDGSDMTPETAIDIDGDGYTYCTGDCCETGWEQGCRETEFPERINSGAYEIISDGIDNNCNGEIDEVVVCDEGLKLQIDDYKGNAVKLAKAMGVCEGLISAELSLAGNPTSELIDENPEACSNNGGYTYNKVDRQSLSMPIFDAKYQTFAVVPKFGAAMTPLEGTQLAILSTGDYDNPTQNAGCATLDAGDMKTASTVPEDWINTQTNCEIPKAPSCGGKPLQSGLTNQCAGKAIPTVQDPIMLTLKMKVPSNAKAFEFNLFFMSIEYSSTVCAEDNYNDFFVALLDSTYNEKNKNAEFTNPTDKNLAKDELGNPVGVDLAPAGLFKACSMNCPGGKTNKWGYCVGDEILAGTGFEAKGQGMFCDGHGGTGWLTVTGNVEPQEEILLRLALWEQGEVTYGPDHSWDSTVVLDGFKWLPKPEKSGVSEK